MRPSDNDLVRVQSEGELKPGVWLFVRGNGQKMNFLLLRDSGLNPCYGANGRPTKTCPPGSSHRGWSVIGEPKYGRVCHESLCYGIKQGFVYRLRDLDDSAEQETSKRREMEDA